MNQEQEINTTGENSGNPVNNEITKPEAETAVNESHKEPEKPADSKEVTDTEKPAESDGKAAAEGPAEAEGTAQADGTAKAEATAEGEVTGTAAGSAADAAEDAAKTESAAESKPASAVEDKPKKSKKGLIIGSLVGLAVLAGCGGAYAYKAQDYRQCFIPGTTINEVDVSEMTVEEAEAKIKEKVESYTVNVSFPGGTSETLSAQDLGYTYVSDGSIQAQMDAQNPYLWGMKYIGRTNSLESSENYSLDASVLTATLQNLPEFREGNYVASTDAGMELGEDQQFTIVKETYGTQLNLDSVMEKIADEIEVRAADVALDTSYYIVPSVYSDDAELNSDMESCNALLKSTITLTLHDKTTYEIGPEQTVEWLALKEGTTNHYYVDDTKLKEKATEAAAAIAEADDCSYDSIQFKSTNRGTRTIHTGTYGCTVDQEKEAEQLVADVLSGTAVERTPNYSREYSYPLGSTYVEVDITNQKVYLYKNGTCILSSSCVTGLDSDSSRRTDRGFFHVTRKNTDYTMRGRTDPATGEPSYESFVNFAVFYNGGEALHDASWRSSFGGSIYKTSGSHGCVNLPYSAAKTVYNNTYVGMPVIVF